MLSISINIIIFILEYCNGYYVICCDNEMSVNSRLAADVSRQHIIMHYHGCLSVDILMDVLFLVILISK